MDLKDLPLHLEGAKFRDEKNHVRWYTKEEGRHNRIHIMIMPDQIISNVWVNGKYVFQQLSTLEGQKKAAFIHLLLV